MQKYLIQGLRDVRKEIKHSFHVPGNKFGKLDQSLELYDFDFTEIPGTDNLHDAEGIIKSSQQRAASLYGADESFFLINGTTCGILAMIIAAVKRGEKLIMARDCHKSVYNAIILGGINPVIIDPKYSEDGLVSLYIDPVEFEELVINNQDAKAVVFAYPNYYGYCSDIVKIVEIAHKYNIAVLIDEAHGSHFAFHEDFPICAVKGGADVVVQSTHKTLPALTQSSVIHFKKGRINLDRFRYYLGVFQSSSPSYVLMASLDRAMEIMAEKGKPLCDRLVQNTKELIEALKENGILTYENYFKIGDELIRDFTRINLSPYGLTESGYELEERLRTDYGIQCEFSNHNCAVFVTSIANDRDDFDTLIYALKRIKESNQNKFRPIKYKNLYSKTLFVCSPDDAVSTGGEVVDIEEAVGRVAGSFVTPYPPGIPSLIPGSIINEETIRSLITAKNEGREINGVSTDNGKLWITVLKGCKNEF